MREIKFCGKVSNDAFGASAGMIGEWVYGSLIVTDDERYLITTWKPLSGMGFQSITHEVDPETVGQYTGIKDKNGKEIYEGDIVKSSYGITGVIKYEKGSFYISLPNRRSALAGLITLGHDFEVIDNIHDNPDLLKGECTSCALLK